MANSHGHMHPVEGLATVTAIEQTLAPLTDVSDGGWEAGNLSSLTSDGEDATAMTASSLGSGDECIRTLTPYTKYGPVPSSVVIHTRAKSVFGSATGDQLTYRILDNGVEILAFTAVEILTDAFQEYTITLSAGQRTTFNSIPTSSTVQFGVAPNFVGGTGLAVADDWIVVTP